MYDDFVCQTQVVALQRIQFCVPFFFNGRNINIGSTIQWLLGSGPFPFCKTAGA
jgi:hypothetical protein